jgi:hypothetical protein
MALLLGLSSSVRADEQAFYNKSFVLNLVDNRGAAYSVRFYISSAGTIFGYSNDTGGCSNTGAFTKLNSSHTESVSCDANGTRLQMKENARASLSGDIVTFTNTTVGEYIFTNLKPERWTQTWSYSFSYDGATCKALHQSSNGKSTATPRSCEVNAGNVAGR